MASLRQTPTGNFIACFRYRNQQHQRALKTKDSDAAKAALGAIVNRIYKLTTGDLAIPPRVDAVDFIVWGEAAAPEAAADDQQEANQSVEQLVPAYLDDQRGLKASSTLSTERTHLNHLKKFLGPKVKLPVGQITTDDLNAFLRQREDARVGVTVRKERQTLRAFFKWAAGKARMAGSPAEELRMVQAGEDKDHFRTVGEVEEILQRGGLGDEEASALWDGLYLTQAEIGAILTTVEKQAEEDFTYPLFAVPAYTGMRRGEIVHRLRWADVNFSSKTIAARSQKQSRQQRETSRSIALHPELESILRAYQKNRPRGQHVICHGDTLAPLTVYEAHDHFQRTLRGTDWERELPSGKKKIVIGFHTFRHSFASNLAVTGVDQRIIDQWMGHQTEEMRKRYQHLFPNNLADAIRTLSFCENSQVHSGGQSLRQS